MFGKKYGQEYDVSFGVLFESRKKIKNPKSQIILLLR